MAIGLLPVGEATRWHVEPNSTGNVYKLGLPSTYHTHGSDLEGKRGHVTIDLRDVLLTLID